MCHLGSAVSRAAIALNAAPESQTFGEASAGVVAHMLPNGGSRYQLGTKFVGEDLRVVGNRLVVRD
jgi:hypothetical protein